MKVQLENKLLAVVRIRGRVGVRQSVAETMDRLNLKHVNNLAILFGTKSNIGMIKKCNDFVTYGELKEETLKGLLERRKANINAADIGEIISGKKNAKELIKMPIRMHPPRKGYEGTKRAYTNKGSLGYRGENINGLIAKML